MNMTTTRAKESIRTVLQDLRESLGVKIVFVCEPVGGTSHRARTIEFLVEDSFLSSRTYPLPGTPCEVVYQRGITYHAHDVADLYPRDSMLREWGLQSYLAVAILDQADHRAAHLGVMHSEAFSDPAAVETALRRAALQLGSRLVRSQV